MEWATLPLRKYADFNGRARRKEFWSFWLLTLAAYMAASIVDGILGLPLLTFVVMLGLICPSIAVAVRRMHDIGKPGWWLLLALIPFFGALALIYFYVQDGQRGANGYGADPKLGETAAIGAA
jgi:uncharacterized membrane protein YhaH (DUF805 family)